MYICCEESDSDLVGYVAESYNLSCSMIQAFLGVYPANSVFFGTGNHPTR